MSAPNDNSDRLERRIAYAAEVQAATGIDEPMIRQLVHAFYDRVRADALLGPIFAARISDWTPHLERMCTFWSSVMLMSGRYHGRPMPAHAPLPINAAHFDHWLRLFTETAHAICPPAAAEQFVAKAHAIAESLERGVALSRGIDLAPGERFRGDSAPVTQQGHR